MHGAWKVGIEPLQIDKFDLSVTMTGFFVLFMDFEICDNGTFLRDLYLNRCSFELLVPDLQRVLPCRDVLYFITAVIFADSVIWGFHDNDEPLHLRVDIAEQ